MSLNYLGGGGGGAGGTNLVQPHSESIVGTAQFHWPLNGDGVESIIGGTVYDLTGSPVFTYPIKGAGISYMDALRSTTTVDSGAIGAASQRLTSLTVAAWVYKASDVGTNLDIISIIENPAPMLRFFAYILVARGLADQKRPRRKRQHRLGSRWQLTDRNQTRHLPPHFSHQRSTNIPTRIQSPRFPHRRTHQSLHHLHSITHTPRCCPSAS